MFNRDKTKGNRGRRGERLLCAALCGSLLLGTAACGAGGAEPRPASGGDAAAQAVSGPEAAEKASENASKNASGNAPEASGAKEAAAALQKLSTVPRPALVMPSGEAAKPQIAAAVPAYEVAPDLSDVYNIKDFYFSEDRKKRLHEDKFLVEEYGYGEFFEVYEMNRYSQTANFVTVDSLMHSYHLYFAYLLKGIEGDHLCEDLSRLTDHMLERTLQQSGRLAASSQAMEQTAAWREAVDRNLAFFAVAKALLEPSWDPAAAEGIAGNEAVLGLIRGELALIEAAAGPEVSPLAGEEAEFEDYSQYKPRGYYDTDEKLSRYFKAMMWYGRRNFTQRNASLDRSALLMSVAVDEEAYADWSEIYAVTSFFAGASDDNGICEYLPVIGEAYGHPAGELDILALAGDEAGWEKYHAMTAALPAPAINSVPMWDDDGATDKTEENLGFRFLGQRFSLDAAVFQRLIYSAVGPNAQADRRMLPDALDLPAALGSDTALAILEQEQQVSGYQDYTENMTELRKKIAEAPAESWRASLYASWLDTLRPLLERKGEGYPVFMQGEKWARKNLESFLGSYTELKHDTVLYSKQVMAEMGGGDEEVLDDRGYVEPEPVVFARFEALARGTAEGLEKYGMLSGDAERDLGRLAELASSLRKIAEKELGNELPTEEEFELIRSYGGMIEHFWQEAYRNEAENPNYLTSEEFPAALVVDIATDPNGQVLQVANDNPSTLIVLVEVDGKVKVARGSVYSFYQFAQPIGQRLTDHEWRVKLGIDMDEDGNMHWEREEVPDKPAWTMDYRVGPEWD